MYRVIRIKQVSTVSSPREHNTIKQRLRTSYVSYAVSLLHLTLSLYYVKMTDKGEIYAFQFSVFSPEEIVAMSTVEVTATKAGAVQKIVNDPRMGPIDSHTLCNVCMQKIIDCPGHFGHIVLAEPIFHPKYFPNIVKILKCICIKCSTPLLPRDRVELCLDIFRTKGQDRLTTMVKACDKIKECNNPKCGSTTNKIRSDSGKIYVLNVVDKRGRSANMVLNAKRVHEILSCISDDDVSLLGFNAYLIDNDDYRIPETMPCAGMKHRHQMRPEWMIFTVFPVVPPCVRPPSYTDDYYPDDLTEKICEIVKVNEKLKSGRTKKKKLTQADRDKLVEKLENHISTYIHNKDGSAKAGGGKARNAARPCKGIGDRLSDKEGHMRHYVFSKRVNFCGRTVIDGDPTLRIDELGVPKAMAMILTVPQVVRPYNIDEITDLIRSGRVNYIYNSKKERIDLRKIKGGYKNFTITEDVYDPKTYILVDVQLRDGDVVIFNRQPTLLPQSMMAFYVRIMEHGKIFRFSPANCTPFNADFDGDWYILIL